MGYAIPISDIEDLLGELMNRETKVKVSEAKQGALGISGQTIDESTSQLYGFPQGVLIREVIEGGAAEAAGIQKGCILTGINGTTIKSMEELQEELTYYEAGETVEVKVEGMTQSGDYVEMVYQVKLMAKSKLNK